jgi:hypothetical protein
MIYIYLIYTSPLFQVGPHYGITDFKISISPITLGNTREKIIDLFNHVPSGGRVALESGNRIDNYYAFEYNCLLSYVLVEENIELLNGYAPEMVESSIYYNFDQNLHKKASEEQIKTALIKGGANYIAVYSEELKIKLESWDYKLIKTADCNELEYNDIIKGTNIYLLQSPFKSYIIEPHTDIFYYPNQINFYAIARTRYLLKYNYYSGWNAYQNGQRIKIIDAKPGMIIESNNDGLIELRYRYRNFWINSFSDSFLNHDAIKN